MATWFNDNVITPLVTFFTGLFTTLSNIFTSIWNTIVTIFTPAVEWFTALFTSIWKTLESIITVIVGLVKGTWKIITVVFGVAAKWFNTHVIQPVAKFFNGLWKGISGAAKTAWNAVTSVFEVAASWFNNTLIKPVTGLFNGLWNTFKTGATNAWEGVKKVFGSVATFFENIFTKAWTAVKNVFSTGGKIFDGIKEGIVDTFTIIVNGLIKGINKIVEVPFKAINGMLNKIRNVGIKGLKPFKKLWDKDPISIPQIPLLERGGILEKGQTGYLEGNGAEAVVPLENNKKWISKTAKDLKQSLKNEGLMNGNGRTQTINNNYNFVQNNTSPKPLNRLEIYRQTKNQFNFATGGGV